MPKDRHRLRNLLKRSGPLLGLLAVIAVFAALSDNPAQYLSLRNLRIVLSQTVIVGLGACLLYTSPSPRDS